MQGKKIKGRKRHLLVDTLGLLIEVLVHSAGIQDRVGARYLLSKAATNHEYELESLNKVWVDGGYSGKLLDWAKQTIGTVLEVIKRSDQHTFKILPKRWVVERTFAWLLKNRRLVRDYERLKKTVESFIHLAMMRLMLRRLVST